MNAVFNWGALSRRSSLEVGLWGRQTPLASRSRPAVAEKACCRRVTPSPRVSSLHLARIGSTSVSTAWDVVRFCRNFPCPTERSCPFLAYWVSCCLRVLSPTLPLSHLITSTQDATQTYPPGGGTLVTSATLQRQFAVPLLESLPVIPRRLDHVSVLRFCISAPSGPGTVARPSLFPLSFAGQQPLQRRQALWTGMIYTNQLKFLVA